MVGYSWAGCYFFPLPDTPTGRMDWNILTLEKTITMCCIPWLAWWPLFVFVIQGTTPPTPHATTPSTSRTAVREGSVRRLRRIRGGRGCSQGSATTQRATLTPPLVSFKPFSGSILYLLLIEWKSEFSFYTTYTQHIHNPTLSCLSPEQTFHNEFFKFILLVDCLSTDHCSLSIYTGKTRRNVLRS